MTDDDTHEERTARRLDRVQVILTYEPGLLSLIRGSPLSWYERCFRGAVSGIWSLVMLQVTHNKYKSGCNQSAGNKPFQRVKSILAEPCLVFQCKICGFQLFDFVYSSSVKS